MKYRVFYTARVTADVTRRIDDLRKAHAAEHVIEAWFGGLFDAIDKLYDMPNRYPVDQPESERLGYKIRKLTYRKYIIRYRVDKKSHLVFVMSFIHGARRRKA